MANAGLRIESKTRGGVSYLRIAGAVDETFDPAALAGTVRGKQAVISLEGVAEIGSGCSRPWVDALESLAAKLDRLIFIDCSRVMVTELNLAPRLVEKVLVVSAKVRHLCRGCNAIARITYDLSATVEAPQRGANTRCGRCGGTLALDENLETYFGFRRHGVTRPVDASALELAAQLGRVLGEKEERAPAPASSTGERPAQTPPPVAAPSASARAPGKRRVTLVVAGVAAAIVAAAVALLSPRGGKDPTPVRAAQEEHAEAAPSKHEQSGEACGRVLRAFQDGKYADIIGLAADFEPSLCDASVIFAVGESYRFMQRLPEGARYYQAMIDAPGAGSHLDDALFWRAEAHLLAGQPKEAAVLFERVTKLRKSTFAVSARRRLKAIHDGSWAHSNEAAAVTAP